MFDKIKTVMKNFLNSYMKNRANSCRAELQRRGFRFDSNGNITGYGSNVF
jgi:hypothetical protein